MSRTFFYLLLFFTGLASLIACNEPSVVPPNVILIVTDDQGYGDVGFQGNSIVRTPAIDAFAANAIVLDNYHSGTTCTPTRAGIMTGRNANRNGSWHTIAGASILNADEETIAEVFQRGGYRTGMFGKWHLGDSYPYRPHDRGFEEAFYHGGGGVQQTPDFWNNDYFDDTYLRNGKPEKTSGYCTDVWFDELRSFIDRSKKQPFFAYLATNAAHGPFNVPKTYHNMYEQADLKPHQINFYGMLTNLDDNLGRLLGFLKNNDLFENTIVIYTTDNGTAGGIAWDKEKQKSYGFNPLRGIKGSHYDGGHRVPFIISWPKGGLKGGKQVESLASHVDLLPTLASLAGVPFTPKKMLDGIDISDQIKGNTTASNRMLITDTQRDQWPEKYKNPCVMQGHWRLVNHKELYNTASDLSQKNNVAASYPDRVKAMQQYYEDWWETTVSEWKHSPTYIGTNQENPVLITIHDMHTTDALPWNQDQVRKGKFAPKGYYTINVAEPGTYTFRLARYPFESELALSDAVPDIPATDYVYGLSSGSPFLFQTAHLQIGDEQHKTSVKNEEPYTELKVALEKGETQLEAWFVTTADEYMPAYYMLTSKQLN